MARNSSKATTDHDEIRRWAEERGGTPAEVATTARGGQTGIIRIDFPGFSGAGKLKKISWDEWFQKFDESNLALVYQDSTARGQKSNFNKIVGRETVDARSRGVRANRRSLRGSGGGRSAGGASAGRSRGRSTRTTQRTQRRSQRAGARRQTGGRKAAPRAEAARTTRASSSSRRGSTGRGRASTGRKTASSRGTSSRRSASGSSSSRRTSSSRRGGRRSGR